MNVNKESYSDDYIRKWTWPWSTYSREHLKIIWSEHCGSTELLLLHVLLNMYFTFILNWIKLYLDSSGLANASVHWGYRYEGTDPTKFL